MELNVLVHWPASEVSSAGPRAGWRGPQTIAGPGRFPFSSSPGKVFTKRGNHRSLLRAPIDGRRQE